MSTLITQLQLARELLGVEFTYISTMVEKVKTLRLTADLCIGCNACKTCSSVGDATNLRPAWYLEPDPLATEPIVLNKK